MTETRDVTEIQDVMALTPLQQGLFALAMLSEAPSDDPYTIAMAFDVSGPLDTELLQNCARALLKRHPNLRARFLSRDLPHPVQIVTYAVQLAWKHVTASPEATAIEADEQSRGFDLERGPPIRFLLIELPDMRWRFLITAHHIVIDGWSIALLGTELLTLYRTGGDNNSLAPPRSYRDYIGWLTACDQHQGQQLWSEHLAGLSAPTILSTAPTLGGVQPSSHRHRGQYSLNKADTTNLLDGAHSHGATLNTLTQLAWALVLSTLTGRHDVVFGVTVSGRPAQLAGVESVVGLCINTVPLRVHLEPQITVAQQCALLQRRAAQLREHAYLDRTQMRALAGVGELFDTLLVFENFPLNGLFDSEGFTVGPVTFHPPTAKSPTHFPVTITAELTDGRFTLTTETTSDALDMITAQRLGSRVLAVAQRLLAMWHLPLRDVSVLLDDFMTGEPATSEHARLDRSSPH